MNAQAVSSTSPSSFFLTEEKVKVLYIAGETRSGSTILGNILGQLEDYIYVGELLNIWRYFLIENRACTCGKPSKECEIWGPVLEQAFGEQDGKFPHDMEYHRLHSNLNRYLPYYIFPPLEERLITQRKPYLDNLGRMYRAIQAETGSELIIDSSKRPTYGRLLELLPNVDFYVVHLIRDPRAVAYSWHRKIMQTDGSQYMASMQQYKTYRTAIRWDIMNAATELFWKNKSGRYLLLRYEDMLFEPQRSIRKILNMLGDDNKILPFVDEKTVNLSVNHLVWGNPNRHRVGLVDLKLDDEWIHSLRRIDKLTVNLLTLPLLNRYQY
jgi:hypothetical protein